MPPAPFTLRPAFSEDAEEVAEIWVRSVQASYRGFVHASFLDALEVPAATRGRRRLSEGRPGARTWIAYDDLDLPLGYIEVGPSPAAGPYEAELFGLYVVPEGQGRGVAGALFDEAVSWLKAIHLTSLRLWVLSGNTRARRFYEKKGGVLAGEKLVELDGRTYAAVSFAWQRL